MVDAEQPRKTYRGNCHCGAFVFEMDAPEIKSVGECNCSICHRKAYLWVFPGKDNFRVVKGGVDQLTSYTFGSKKMEHKFCPTCATPVMATATDLAKDFPPGMEIGVNVHSIQGINTWALEKNAFDGKSKWGTYEPLAHKGDLPSVEIEGSKPYNGSCHCGKVTVAVTCKPLDETYDETLVECNCSICERGGYVWAYTKNEQVILSGAEEDIGGYIFARGILTKTFCRTCGVLMTNRMKPLSPEAEARLSDDDRKWLPVVRTHHPVNLRVLEGVDLAKLKTQKREGRNLPPLYVNP